MAKENEKSLSYDDNELVDITNVVESCSSSLSALDPFLCDNNFNLRDSMAALELMDPKLDCCEIHLSAYNMTRDGNDKPIPPRPLPTGLEGLPWESLTLREARIITLEILTRLESLLSGASLSESTFTCLYTHAAVMRDMHSRLVPPGLTERMEALVSSKTTTNATPAQHVVYSASLGLVAISHSVHSICFNADIYEEEDFSLSSYGLLDFFGDSDEASALNALDLALEQVDDSEDSTTIKLVLGILNDILRSSLSLASLSAATVRDLTERTKPVVSNGVRKLERLLQLISSDDSKDGDALFLSRCFDLYVNRPLVGNTPIRKVSFRSPVEAIGLLKKVLSEVDWAVCDFLLGANSLGRIRYMLERVSAASVNILSRSLIVLNLYFDNLLLGQHEVWSLVADDVIQLSGAQLSMIDTKYGRAFLHRLAKPIYDTFKLLLLNRNRQRAFMETVLLEEWSTLQREAHVMDASLQTGDGEANNTPAVFSLYTLRTTISLMERHLSLGIELELFRGKRDLSMAFWYRDFLLSSLLNNMASMRQSMILARRQQAAQAKKGKRKGSAKRKAQGKSKSSEAQDLEDDYDLMIVRVKRDMCRGLVRVLAALGKLKMLCPHTFQFTCFKQRFQKQFNAFSAVLHPPLLTYDDYQQGFHGSGVKQSDLLLSAADCFKQSKAIIDKLLHQIGGAGTGVSSVGESELRSLARVCVGNSVFIHKLTHRMQSSGMDNAVLSFDLKSHPQFCVFNIA